MGSRVRVLYLVLDGAPDGFSLDPSERALERASKPALDSLAGSGECGLVYTVGRGIAPESDVAVMSLLGYDPERYYTGRGPLEAVGAGLDLEEGSVALRANFATIDPVTRRIIDRRVGRSLSSGEAVALASSLDGMELNGGRARAVFRATIGHRGVLIITHQSVELSGAVTNTDPAYERRGRISVALDRYEPFIARCRPLEDSPGAAKAAELVNEFTERSIEILESHEVNIERAARGLPKANAVLLRDAGDSLPEMPSFRSLFGFRGASIVEMVVERGIARLAGLDDYEVEVEGRDRREVLREEADMVLELLRSYDLVYVHLKGPDEPGHDGDLEGKVRAIEDIDEWFLSRVLDGIDPEETAIVVTSDHSTPWKLRAHSSDPVPLLISHPGLGRGPGRFSEEACKSGGLGLVEAGYRIIPLVKEKLGI